MSAWVRQIHRWVCVVFTAGVTLNIVVIFGLGQEKPSPWVGLAALGPLVLLLLTGLYMFVSPYAAKWGGGSRRP